jgi:hypothetical protein
MRLKNTIVFSLCAIASTLYFENPARAQANRQFLTNEPGTPGNASWEINLVRCKQSLVARRPTRLSQNDLNFGLGDRIKLKYDIPSVLQGVRHFATFHHIGSRRALQAASESHRIVYDRPQRGWSLRRTSRIHWLFRNSNSLEQPRAYVHVRLIGRLAAFLASSVHHEKLEVGTG